MKRTKQPKHYDTTKARKGIPVANYEPEDFPRRTARSDELALSTGTFINRNTKEVDWALLERCCRLHCTQYECASLQAMHVDTLLRKIKEQYGVTFSEYYDQFAADGKMALRRKQFEMAMKGDRALLIHLGRHWLGQTDEAVKNPEGDGENDSGIMNMLRDAAKRRSVSIKGAVEIQIGEERPENEHKPTEVENITEACLEMGPAE